MLGSLVSLPRHWRVILAILVQLVVGGLFVYAGVSKVMDPLRFASSVLGYQLIPVGLVRPIVWILPWVEIGLGLSFLTGRYLRLSALGLLVLLVIFTLMLSIALSKGWVIDCGCFGAPRPVDLQKILENIAMLIAVALMAKYPGWGLRIEDWLRALKGSD